MPPSVNLGPPNISESKGTRVKIKNAFRLTKVLASGTKNFPLGAYREYRAPNVNFGPPKISETTRARMLKLKTQLDIAKCSLWVKKPLGASRGRRAP